MSELHRQGILTGFAVVRRIDGENVFLPSGQLCRVVHACGLEKRNFHVLRHTFATRCVEAKIDIKTLSEILGHSSVTITMNRYVHPSLELKRETMEQLADFISVK